MSPLWLFRCAAAGQGKIIVPELMKLYHMMSRKLLLTKIYVQPGL
jgi:hypothetical protein